MESYKYTIIISKTQFLFIFVGLPVLFINDWKSAYVSPSVVDPNTLDLDPYSGFWPNLEPDPGFWPILDPDPGPDLDPGLCYQV